MKPKLLDLFCGAGGCAMGYHRAGFDVVGIDNRLQPRYPFQFHQADALEWVRDFGHLFDVIHASPPCQRFTQAQRLQGRDHPDLLTPSLEAIASRKVWVVENVPGAPMFGAVTICGLALGVKVKRHRLFLSSHQLLATTCPPGHRGEWYTVFGKGALSRKRRSRFSRETGAAKSRLAMGIDWMTREELSQAIPPVYTEFIGIQLKRFLE